VTKRSEEGGKGGGSPRVQEKGRSAAYGERAERPEDNRKEKKKLLRRISPFFLRKKREKGEREKPVRKWWSDSQRSVSTKGKSQTYEKEGADW